MAEPPDKVTGDVRDVESVYSVPEFVAKLRRLRRCPKSYDSRVMNPVSTEEDR